MDNLALGKLGEQLAKDFLVRHKLDIVTGHWQKRVGEIDVIAHDPETDELIFVEVKTRSDLSFGYPEAAVDKKKLQKIYKTAQWFLITYNYPTEQKWQIDVIGIVINKKNQKAQITHFKNVEVG